MPRIVSLNRKFPIFWNNLKILSGRFLALYFIPSKRCNWFTIIITEVAEVNPDVTGIDIKSTKKPKKNHLDYKMFNFLLFPFLHI